ncbi:expressed unknown protein [Seminavis robusta]|uniref:Uncharacterized protein n=1 Tax=Seminavis robusta TaxID=568900 RepID=A0A9N8HJ07_9STRA|nr:expressed unknown protein [Seminavis robusta]|eukprot:Sro733_g194580.1 n/a (398) ;mRNA; f:33195-34388
MTRLLVHLVRVLVATATGVSAFVPQQQASSSARKQWSNNITPLNARPRYYQEDEADLPPWVRDRQREEKDPAWPPEYSDEVYYNYEPEPQYYHQGQFNSVVEEWEDEFLEAPPRESLPRSRRREDTGRDTGSIVPQTEYLSKQEEEDLEEEEETTITKTTDTERVLAAGVGTGVLGMLVGGPIGAVVLGFSSAFAAENCKENTIVGDSARAIGDVAIAATKKGVEINQKHNVVDKTIVAAEDAWEKAKELDREHKIVQKAKDVAIYGGTATVDFVRKHNLVEKGVKGIGQGIGWVTERVVAGSLDGETSSDTPPNKHNSKRRRRMKDASPGPPPALEGSHRTRDSFPPQQRRQQRQEQQRYMYEDDAPPPPQRRRRQQPRPNRRRPENLMPTTPYDN